jgi:hypothetical protein
MSWRIVAVVAVVLAARTSARAVSEENFQLRNGADLLALCSVSADDPLRASAIHMCHGFCVGVYQTILALTMRDKLKPIACPPEPPPQRSEAIEHFVIWGKTKTEYQGDRPADFVGRYIVETYPCPKEPDERAPAKKSRGRRHP